MTEKIWEKTWSSFFIYTLRLFDLKHEDIVLLEKFHIGTTAYSKRMQYLKSPVIIVKLLHASTELILGCVGD